MLRDSSRRRLGRSVHRPAQGLAAGSRSISARRCAIAQPDALGAALARLGAGKKRVLADPATCAAWVFDRLTEAGAIIIRAPDPCLLPKACKNRRRAGRNPQRPPARRRGADPVPRLASAAAAPRAGSRRSPSPTRSRNSAAEAEHFQGLSFATISGAGAERRHRPLPRLARDRTRPGERRPLSGRFRRAISRRHHRRHPHGGDRQSDRGNARPLHPGAEGPYRAGAPAAFRKAPPARSSTRWRAGRCGRPGSITTTAPATASAPISACMKGRSASPR